MRTPSGQECRFYYADYNRGRDIQRCRLVEGNVETLRWRPSDCGRCPVPGILQANASPDLDLTLTIRPRLLGLGRENRVTARCARHQIPIEDPRVGCARCNEERPGLDLFRHALEQLDDD